MPAPGNPTRTNLADAWRPWKGRRCRGDRHRHGGRSPGDHGPAQGGDLLIAPDCYGGTWRLFEYLAAKGPLPGAVRGSGGRGGAGRRLAQQPALVGGDPLQPAAAGGGHPPPIATASHEVGAKVVVDNTFLSPLLHSRSLGADVVVHSTTKYISSHSDVVVGGVAIAKEAEAGRLPVCGGPSCLGLTSGGLRLLPHPAWSCAPWRRACVPIRRTRTGILAFLQQQPLVKKSITPACRAIRARHLRAVNSPASAPC